MSGKAECSNKHLTFNKVKIFVEDKIESVCPSFVGACVEADVEKIRGQDRRETRRDCQL